MERLQEKKPLEISKTYISETEIYESIKYVIKKLDFTQEEFDIVFSKKNKNYLDYPSYYPMMVKFSKLTNFILKYVLFKKPMALFQIEMRKKG